MKRIVFLLLLFCSTCAFSQFVLDSNYQSSDGLYGGLSVGKSFRLHKNPIIASPFLFGINLFYKSRVHSFGIFMDLMPYIQHKDFEFIPTEVRIGIDYGLYIFDYKKFTFEGVASLATSDMSFSRTNSGKEEDKPEKKQLIPSIGFRISTGRREVLQLSVLLHRVNYELDKIIPPNKQTYITLKMTYGGDFFRK